MIYYGATDHYISEIKDSKIAITKRKTNEVIFYGSTEEVQYLYRHLDDILELIEHVDYLKSIKDYDL